MTKTDPKVPSELKVPKNKAQYIKLVRKGESLHNSRRYVDALQYLTTAWKYDASSPTLLTRVADCLFKIGRKSAAMNLLTHALESAPNDAGIASVLGNAALEMDFFELSQKFHQHYINLKPNDPVGYNNYASALRENGQYDEAIAFLQDILPVFPTSEILWNTLGSIVSFRDGMASAIVFYEECLKINPNNYQALNNVAPAYASINDFKKAEETIRKAIKLDPATTGPHMFLSSLLLNDKRLKEGWEEYQYRNLKGRVKPTIQRNKIPYWQGESLEGKKIFIFGEQGIGDEILFTWLYNKIIEEADHVGLACEPRLVPLFKNSFPQTTISKYVHKHNLALDVQLTTFPDINVAEYDFQCCAGDLAKIKWESYEDVKPTSEPILLPSNDKIEFWHKRIKSLPKKLSVGIAWQSGIKHAKRARNYAPLLSWKPFLGNTDINYVNVQYGDCKAELEEFKNKTGIKIHNFDDLDLKDDFEGTTAMMKSLDLVMGPASAPIMQSSFAGVPTWCITSGVPWWSFGDDIPVWRQNLRVIAKNDSEDWKQFMLQQAILIEEWYKENK